MQNKGKILIKYALFINSFKEVLSINIQGRARIHILHKTARTDYVRYLYIIRNIIKYVIRM